MRSTPRSIRLTLAVIAAALAAATIPAAANAGRVPDDWGWAVVRSPGRSAYVVTGKDRASSTGGEVKVKRLGKGYHKVRFMGIITSSPHVQVTPLSDTAAMCSYYGLGFAGKPLAIYVHCSDRRGVPGDIPFMVDFLESHGPGAPPLAYLWANQPRDASYVAHPEYAYTSNGTDIHVQGLGVGRYRVRLAGFGGLTGNIQVTPYAQKPRTCRVSGWATDVPDLTIDVRCRDQKGAEAHSHFQLLFSAENGLKGNALGDSWAYLFANRSQARGYRPDTAYSGASPVGDPWVRRLEKGRYLVKLPTMPMGGAVQVTAVHESRYCVATTVRKSDKPQRIEVRCFGATGKARADAKFMLSYAR